MREGVIGPRRLEVPHAGLPLLALRRAVPAGGLGQGKAEPQQDRQLYEAGSLSGLGLEQVRHP